MNDSYDRSTFKTVYNKMLK